VFLRQPDAAAPHDGPAFDAVVARLVALIRQQADCTAILAPWRHDPHCDHAAASKLAGAAAAATGVRDVAFPVWGWTLPGRAPVPDAPGPGWRLDIATFLPAKRAAIQAHRSQYGGLITDDPDGFRLPPALLSVFDNPYETYLPVIRASRPADHFEGLYKTNPDPWRFETSSYEQAKYQKSLDALGDRSFASGLEVGCSIGVLTRMLASRCERVPLDWPNQTFDLIVFSEVLYFLSAADIERTARRVLDTLAPSGTVLLVSWTGKTDDPSSGDTGSDCFIFHVRDRLWVTYQDRQPNYRLDVLTAA
jgi:hypothetical protein